MTESDREVQRLFAELNEVRAAFGQLQYDQIALRHDIIELQFDYAKLRRCLAELKEDLARIREAQRPNED